MCTCNNFQYITKAAATGEVAKDLKQQDLVEEAGYIWLVETFGVCLHLYFTLFILLLTTPRVFTKVAWNIHCYSFYVII